MNNILEVSYKDVSYTWKIPKGHFTKSVIGGHIFDGFRIKKPFETKLLKARYTWYGKYNDLKTGKDFGNLCRAFQQYGAVYIRIFDTEEEFQKEESIPVEGDNEFPDDKGGNNNRNNKNNNNGINSLKVDPKKSGNSESVNKVNEIMKKMDSLEEWVKKSYTEENNNKRIFLDIPIGNKNLISFFQNLKSEDDLEKLVDEYELYQDLKKQYDGHMGIEMLLDEALERRRFETESKDSRNKTQLTTQKMDEVLAKTAELEKFIKRKYENEKKQDYITIKIPKSDGFLNEFYSKITTTEKLQDLAIGYNWYKEWIQGCDNNEHLVSSAIYQGKEYMKGKMQCEVSIIVQRNETTWDVTLENISDDPLPKGMKLVIESYESPKQKRPVVVLSTNIGGFPPSHADELELGPTKNLNEDLRKYLRSVIKFVTNEGEVVYSTVFEEDYFTGEHEEEIVFYCAKK
ncbi:uncharacterized protein NDAI_0A03470 [Naumovozyma dairenensis CBS 421]|uniref:Autophagy protein Atg19/Atg34 C-terminal domain-containing protein n=1 Tax=Naumovozyma dairenensis (strain ATCC 10597 / BCRC 20456 / CBS 421 / NBRC 0211 / NRRL Y-12639) TaxID=1071378 RepID=G0W3W6_NAUDC|nr:hypothetical protein NDAI_0A03470 [Naumovozyma dairenensis CBS 421]CCD22504.1 hypothetical protein NDAI_0A03470 [Naumovozyma dairenensis CBS 421]